MAVEAGSGRVRAGENKAGDAVIEVGAIPTRRRVAFLTGLREAGRHVVGVGRALEIGLVTGVAISWCAGVT